MTVATKTNSASPPAGPGKPGRQRRRRGREVNGILLLDKPIGLSSNQALQKAKRLFQANKAGHTGSLDPLASGMLPLCFGQATKVSGWLLEADKCYEVVASIGLRTDTADAEGKVVETSEVTEISRVQLEQALDQFRGDIEQIPPMYSALKKDGQRLYELARKGQVVERAPRSVCIHELEILHFDAQQPRLRVRCSKGTYIRTLVEDIAAAAGTLAHVIELRRTLVEPFGQETMVSMEQLEAGALSPESLDSLLLPTDRALEAYPAVHLGASEAFYLRNGHAVSYPGGEPGAIVRLYDEKGGFLGVGELLGDGQVAPKRLFAGPLPGQQIAEK